MRSNKIGVSTTGIKSVFIGRNKNGIKSIKFICYKCLYYNRKICNFNKVTSNRKHSIKFIKAESYNDNIVKKKK